MAIQKKVSLNFYLKPNPMDPATLQNLLILACPFLAFFAGIVIRKVALPGRNSPPMYQQLLLGIPICLIVISPLLPLLQSSASTSNFTVFLVTVGIIMEHGMIVPETATDQLNKLRQRGRHSALGV
ncbi:MAG: hypothetical protein QOE34_2512 [Verrucomicrobiota bacterium]|jgi:hypothetical protein